MALERDPDQLNRLNRDEELRRRQILDNEMRDDELQADPELAEGPASGPRMALFAVAVIIVLGVVFYGLNHAPVETEPASTASQNAPATTGSNTAKQTPGPAAPANSNTNPGQTTGAAPAAAPPKAPASTPAKAPPETPATAPNNSPAPSGATPQGGAPQGQPAQ